LPLTLELVGDPLPAGEAPIAARSEAPATPILEVPAGRTGAKLELAGDPAPADDSVIVIDYSSPAVAKPVITAGMTSEERFLAQATREYQAGTIDQPLWARAVALAQGDDVAALDAYLRGRATALRVLDRATRRERADLRERALREPHETTAEATSPDGVASRKASRIGRGNLDATARRRIVIAAMLGLLVVVVGLLGVYWAGDSTDETSVAARAPAAFRSGPATRTKNRVAAPGNAAVDANSEDPGQEFMTRIQELKNAGNWNVVILYASAWTRKQPGNASAWRELTLGYANMRQFDDALGAATKAVQLAPKDALLWRNLGQVNMDLDDPVAALRAFEEATLLNEQDVYSLAQAGILNTRLGRLPEARLAFAKALALNPDDADARCGETLIALKQARVNEGNVPATQARANDGRCRDVIDRTNATVVLTGPTAFKVAPAGGR
jgi:tetratricopeptide (TPR) repeat protein